MAQAEIRAIEQNLPNPDYIRDDLITRNPDFEIIVNKAGTADVWKYFGLIRYKGITYPRHCVCTKCHEVLAYRNASGRSSGTSTISSHASGCHKSTGIQLTLAQVTRGRDVVTKIRNAHSDAIKAAQVKYVVKGSHSFRSVENEGLYDLCQFIADIAAQRAETFDVRKVLFGRMAVQRETLSLAETARLNLKTIVAPYVATDCASMTIDMSTDDLMKRSYLDIHLFWIEEDFTLRHAIAAMHHFGTDPHTGDRILETTIEILKRFKIPESVSIITDHGSNVVNAFRDHIRLDCFDHRLHTCVSWAWDRTKEQVEAASEYDAAVGALSTYAKQCSGVQEQLPITLESGCATRTWTGMFDRADAISRSHEAVKPILDRRGRSLLLRNIDLRLNADLLKFLKPIEAVFKRLEQSERPTLQLVAPSYYILAKICAPSRNDVQVIRVMKKIMLQQLDAKYFTSIKHYHWIACFLDPTYKSMSFVPRRTEAEQTFLRDLNEDLPTWVKNAMQDVKNKTDAIVIEEVVDEEVPAADAPVNNDPNAVLDPFDAMRDEYDTYKAGVPPVANGDIQNPLSYWKAHADKLPLLAETAKHILVSPASSSQSERDFSHMGITLNKRRASLGPETLEALEVLHSHFLAGLI